MKFFVQIFYPAEISQGMLDQVRIGFHEGLLGVTMAHTYAHTHTPLTVSIIRGML